VSTTGKSLRVIDHGVREDGLISGAIVGPGGSLVLTGTSDRDIVVEIGGTLVVQGMVNAAVVNRGGQVIIHGKVDRLDARSGRTRITGVVHRVTGGVGVTVEHGAVVDGRIED
jgi:hypothetical protein